ncbi:MAG: GAF domain-containing protein, partial [Bacteroidetes bacterium]|nr:GAF domain-containing protein [Bacteroidota bacterium]
QVGSAIHNVRYLEKEQHRYKQRVQDISALKEINSAILHKNLKNVTQLILEKIIELTGGSYSTLRLLDESGKFLKLEALEGRDTMNEILPVDENSISGWIAMTGESVICPDVRDCPHYTQWYPDVKSCMATPLKSSGQVIGTLYVESTDLGAFSEQYQLDLLQALADQASIVIENMQFYEQRAKDMDALREINEVVVSGELDKILKIIIQKAVQTMPGEYSSLWLIDPGTGDLILQAVRGPGEEITRKVRRIQTGAASINVLVAKEGKPYICGDAEADPYFYKIYDKAKSSITVPLKYRDRTIGTLNVESSKLEAFNDQHRQLLVSFSDQAAIAIENAKLYKNLQMQGEAQIEAIGKISSSIAASLNLEDVLDSILDWTIKLMGEASLGEIRLLDSKTNELVVAQYRGEDTIDKYMSVPVGKGITGWVAQHRTPLMVPDVSEDSRYLPFLDGTKSEIAVPMLKEDELIGVLNVEHHRINAFTDYDFKIAGAIANLAAIAIGNARMYEQLQKQREEQIKAIGEISESIAAPQELNRILGGILDWTISLMGEACLAEVKLFESRTNELVTKCVRGISKQEFRRIPVGLGITGWVAQTRKPVIVPDVSKDNRYSRLLEDTNSEIAVPILKKEELIGVLNIEHPNTNAFTEDDLGLAVAIANITAIAIDNAQIYNQLARKIANLGAVNKVGQMLTSGIDLTEQQILMSIYNHTKELMDVENMYIALYEPDQDEPDKYYPDEPGESIIHGTVRFGLVIDNDRLLDIVNETEWWKRKA